MTLPAEAWKLREISPRAYQHPADRAATAGLHNVPYLDQVVRKLVSLGYERALRAAALGSAVKLGERQLPHVWVLQREVFNALDMDDVPDLYLTQYPIANAFTSGSERPVVVVNSELIRLLDDEGRRVVLAHEAAHIQSDHVLYQTALAILLRIGTSVRLPILAGLPLLAIRYALLEWSRAAELSCDRAAALVTRDPLAVCKALMVITAGEEAENLSLDAFIAQGMDYDLKGSGGERLTRMLQDLNVTHPLPVRRVKLMLDWVREGEYDRIVGGEYIRRGEEAGAKEEAIDAKDHYADRIAGAVAEAGSSVADMGQQLGDWLKKQGSGGSGGNAEAADAADEA
jgi:Zn-dependent protease with chaperone function